MHPILYVLQQLSAVSDAIEGLMQWLSNWGKNTPRGT